MTRLFTAIAAAGYRHAWVILAASALFLTASPLMLRGLRVDADASRISPSSDIVSRAYRENKAVFGETDLLVLRLVLNGTNRQAADAFTDRLAGTLAAWKDIGFVETGPAAARGTADSALRLRAALLNSTPSPLDQVAARFSENGLERELRKSRRLLVSIDDPELRALVVRDVLNIRELVTPFFLARAQALGTFGGSAYFDAPDRSSRILFVQPTGSAEDGVYCPALLARIAAAVAAVKREVPEASALEVAPAGLHAVTGQSTQVAMRDLQVISVVSSVLVIGVFWITFGRLRAMVICAYPLLVSMVAVSLVARLFFNPINYGTIGFVGIMLGLGDDIVLHLTGRYYQLAADRPTAEALAATYADCGLPLFAGLTTTAAAFLPLVLAHVPGLTQLGVLTAVGLMLMLVITLVVFPGIARLLAPSTGSGFAGLNIRWMPRRLLRLPTAYPRTALVAGAVLVAGGALLGRGFQFDMDIFHLVARELPALEAARGIASSFKTPLSSPTVVTLQSADHTSIMHAQRTLDLEIGRLVERGEAVSFESPSIVLIYPAVGSGDKAEAFGRAARAVREGRPAFFRLLRELRFKDDPAFTEYYDTLALALAERSDGPEAWSDQMAGAQRIRQLAARDQEGYRFQTFVWPAVDTATGLVDTTQILEMSARLDRLPLPPGVSIQTTGAIQAYQRVNELIRADFFRLVGIAAVAVVTIIIGCLRSPLMTVLSLLPLAAAVPVTIGAMVVLRIPFTPTAIACSTVLGGIAVDYAIHIIVRVNQAPSTPVGDVVEDIGPVTTLAALTTAIGFASLALSRLTVVAAMGEMIAIGVLACWVFTFLLVPPVLELRRSAGDPAGPRASRPA